jgi:DNA polymerase-3 subunit alpha
MKKADSFIPFVGLHAHSVVGSPFDAFGYPQEHMDYAYKNGSRALALTDHGNMNGMAHQVMHAKEMQRQNKNFKPIFGVEAYFIPSIKEWKMLYEQAKEDKKEAKKLQKNDGKMTTENEGDSKKKNDPLYRRRHLVLLAQNQIGLNNIFKMISLSHQGDNFYRYPRLDYDILNAHSEGVIASSACLGGVYAGNYWDNVESGPDAILEAMRETTEKMQSIFGDRWFGELQWNSVREQHELNEYIIQIHYETGIELISTADSHYPNPEAWKDRELYKRLGYLNRPKKPEWMSDGLPESVAEIGYELYPKNGNQMWDSYKKYSEESRTIYNDDLIYDSIVKTHWIAHEIIEDFFPDDTVRLPGFVIPEGQTATEALMKAAVTGLRELGLHTSEEYCDRLKLELNVIVDRGFSKYFLTMKAVADKASEHMLAGPGRGSAAGSLTAYVLGITQVDPIKHGLLFSRFLRSDATDYPDIDYDVSDAFGLKEILAQEWGDTTVVPISNYNTLQLKSLVKDISKFYEIPFAEVNMVTGRMVKEATPKAKEKQGIKAGLYIPTFEEVMEFSDSLQDFLAKYPHIRTHIEALYGQIRSISRHAGGVVIGENLDRHMPLIQSGGVIQTPWVEGQNLRHLEPMGFIKFDLLGLSTLEMIESAVAHILRRHHGVTDPTFEDIKKYYDENLHPDRINLSDQNVYKNIFQEGKFIGVFQFTNSGAQRFCKRVQPTNIIDISAITSIYRPGPLSANVDRSYVAAKRDPDEIHYINDLVKEVTEETSGFLIFQEQIALLAHKLGKDLTLDEGNKLRKLLTKKGEKGKGAKEKQKIRSKFMAGCLEKNIDATTAGELWRNFEYFSGYGFNKSHAVCYTILSYQCAWLLNYYPECWVAAFLDKEPETRKEAAISLAKQYGFNVQDIDINTSSGTYWGISDDGKTLIQSLNSIKGLGESAIKQIVENRPFKDAEDLLFREEVVYSKFNKKALDVLCRSGALESVIDDRFSGMKHFYHACVVNRPKNKKKLLENIEEFNDEGEFSHEEKIEYITDLTGIFPFEIVMSKQVAAAIRRYEVPPLGEWDRALAAAWFIPREKIVKKTKNDKVYWVLKVIDNTSTANVIRVWGVDPERHEIHMNRPYGARLDYNEEWGFSLRLNKRNRLVLLE